MVKILCVLTSDEHGFYLPEIAHPFHRFKAAGFDVDICSIKGGKAPVSPQSIDLTDEDNKNFYETESIWKLTENTATLSSYDASAYDGVFYVGGFGTMWDFPESPDVIRVAEEVYKKGGVVAGVCHGPIAFAHAKGPDGEYLIKGKKIAGFTSAEEDVVGLWDALPDVRGLGKSLEQVFIARGAEYTKADPWMPHIEIDGTLMTGQNPASAAPLGDAIVKYFNTK